MKKLNIYFTIFLVSFFWTISISQKTILSNEFELDLALGSTYDASTTRSLLGVSSSGEAKLEGSNLSFIYMMDDNVGYGLRLANHEGEDTKDLFLQMYLNYFLHYNQEYHPNLHQKYKKLAHHFYRQMFQKFFVSNHLKNLYQYSYYL